MDIKKILEIVFIKEWNTVAYILDDDIVVSLWHGVFLNRNSCFDYIDTYFKGWVQSSLSYRNTKQSVKTVSDTLIKYDELYDKLENYAKETFGDKFKKLNTVDSFTFNWSN